MTHRRNHIFTFMTAAPLLLGALSLNSQVPVSNPTQPSPQPQPASTPTAPKPLPAFYRNIVVIDPAHGGPDTGAHLPNSVLEKDVTLSFSTRLRTLLAAAGFTVISTRDSDPSAILTTDQRASVANHTRPIACLLLHATSSGSGVNIVTSDLTPPDNPNAARAALAWQTAQAPTVPQSLRLANELGLALQNNKLPVVLLRASIPPIDNLTCAAAAIEIAPLAPSGAQPIPVTNGSYQQHVAEAIADALSSFRDHNAPLSLSATGAAK